MLKIASILAALALPFASSGQAEPLRLSALEVRELLSGRTAIGTWSGARYRQWFASDGSTIYAQWGARSALGKWRVNSQTDAYESVWERPEWTGYRVMRIDGQLHWTDLQGNNPQPFRVLPGQQLVWP